MASGSGPAVLAPLGANCCPTCRADHERIPGGWPICPDHEHALYLHYRDNTGFHYACPAWKCKHTHTQPERPTMTVTEAATAALAIRPGQHDWTPQQLSALRQIGAEDAPDGDLQVFFHYCQATGLDPFAKQIRLRKDRQKVKDANGREQWENRWSIETEIDGYRVIAHRAAKRDGVELSYGPPVWFDRAGGEHKIWLGDEAPAGAGRTVYKDGKPFPAVVRLKSFAKYTQGGQLQAMWAVMPDHLLAKCAEAQALRMAFPHDLAGIHISDEAAAAGNGAPQLTAQQAPAQDKRQVPPSGRRRTGQRQQAPRDGVVIKALGEAIGKQFDRLEIDGPDERENWVRRLNQDAEGELTAHQLRFALSTLAEKNEDGSFAVPDLAALVELCDPGTPAEPVEDEIEAPF